MSLKYQTGEDEAPAKQEKEDAARPLRTPIPYYTVILLACIGMVFVTQLVFGDALHSFVLGDDFSAFAAGFYKPRFVALHEYWRILTGATVHGGILHVVMNGYALYSLGRLFEMLSNRSHLAIVFVTACIGGGLLSLIFLPDGSSVGASGGIVGLLGYITVYAFRRRRFISAAFRKNLVANIGFLFVFGLVFFNSIDNYGHLGGLIIGVVYGFLLIPTNEYLDPRTSGPIARYVGLFALGLYIDAALLSTFLIAAYRIVVFQ